MDGKFLVQKVQHVLDRVVSPGVLHYGGSIYFCQVSLKGKYQTLQPLSAVICNLAMRPHKWIRFLSYIQEMFVFLV